MFGTDMPVDGTNYTTIIARATIKIKHLLREICNYFCQPNQKDVCICFSTAN